ncbi:hypothetical protein D0Z00_003350 [Geotrichum galactomycetum]|uniref:Uncharacterized protein n=1 Tax=Geotrichum galactomycetum TaxID=27317 RepID=A0ACB6V1G8_9ASCO|nr:hypothetical protein D0Z00_003350 [Geotrichum candidum]
MSTIPEAIKPVVQTYYQRGQELRTINPLITYFCKLYVIQAAIATNLHQSDPAVAQFVGAELDAVELLKGQLTTGDDNDPDAVEETRQIINNVDHKGFEYIREFATSILDSGYTDILAQKSSKTRTVPKLMAASTFLSLALAVFRAEDEPEAWKLEVRDKIKFAKWHAARIVRASKNGEDPNAYVPPEVEALRQAEQQATQAERAVDAAEQEENVESTERAEEDEDEQEAKELLLRMRAEMDAEPVIAAAGTADMDGELVLPSASSHDPASVDNDDHGGFTLPSAASHDPASEPDFRLPSAASHDPELGADFSLPAAASHPPGLVKPSSSSPPPPPPAAAVPKPAVIRPTPGSPQPAPPTTIITTTTHTKAEIATILSNSEIFTKSQKHAKFAISALNYEDVATAIRELNQALALLHQVQE